MRNKLKVTKTRSKFWAISKVIYYEEVGSYFSTVLAVCKTKKEAEKLQNKEYFRNTSLDHVPLYMHSD